MHRPRRTIRLAKRAGDGHDAVTLVPPWHLDARLASLPRMDTDSVKLGPEPSGVGAQTVFLPWFMMGGLGNVTKYATKSGEAGTANLGSIEANILGRLGAGDRLALARALLGSLTTAEDA